MGFEARTILTWVAALVLGCAGCSEPPKAPSTASSEAPSAEAAAPAEPSPEASPSPAPSAPPATTEAPSDGLPASCTRLITCCDAWVKTTPTAKVGCDAQRQAFDAAKTPEARGKLGDLCTQALSAWSRVPSIPEACK